MSNERRSMHIGMFSTGKSSAYACQLMIDEVGKENSLLFFTDTRMEDEDNYRFMSEMFNHFGVSLAIERWDEGSRAVHVHTGLNPFDLFDKQGMLGSNRIALCSRILKREQTEKFVQEGDTLWWGIDIEEKHRSIPIRSNWEKKGVHSRFPLIERYTTHAEPIEWLERIGIKPPRMYELGFAHANCSGMCVRGGLGHWAHLYRVWPDRYAYAEERERQWQQLHGKDHTILRKSVNGKRQNISLERYRKEYLEVENLEDTANYDSGACACMEVYEGDDR